ncbi:MAG TPA: hypothetical protein VN420_03260 [Candidatus Fimivivens sp.]|nr:hypothetical protein [Candidatus Fimivivens sp.]
MGIPNGKHAGYEPAVRVVFVNMAGHRIRLFADGRPLPEWFSQLLSWRCFTYMRRQLGLRRKCIGLRELTEVMLCTATTVNVAEYEYDPMIFISGRQEEDLEGAVSASEWFITRKFEELKVDRKRYSTRGISGDRHDNVREFLKDLMEHYPDTKEFCVFLVDAEYRIGHVRTILQDAAKGEGLSVTVHSEAVRLRWSWRSFLEGYWFDVLFDRFLVSRWEMIP